MMTTQSMKYQSETTDLPKLAGRAQEVKTTQNSSAWPAAQDYFSAISRPETL
jgi:hypothetical protein